MVSCFFQQQCHGSKQPCRRQSQVTNSIFKSMGQFSSVLWPIMLSGGHEGQFSRDPLPVFSAGGPHQQFWHRQGCPFLMLSIHHFLYQSQCHPPSKAPWRMVLERLLRHVTCLNHASFCLLTIARRGSCGPTRELILLRTLSLVLCSK